MVVWYGMVWYGMVGMVWYGRYGGVWCSDLPAQAVHLLVTDAGACQPQHEDPLKNDFAQAVAEH